MTSRDVIDASIAQHNRRAETTMRDVEPIARAVVFLAIAVLGACAIVHWATPCQDGQQCLALLATPRRAIGNALAGSWLHRLWLWPQAAYLRMVINWAHDEVDEMNAMLWDDLLLPEDRLHMERQIRSHRLWIDVRRLRLADIELTTRRI